MSRSRRDDAAAGYLSGAADELVELELVVLDDGESEDDAVIRQQVLSECERHPTTVGRIDRGRA